MGVISIITVSSSLCCMIVYSQQRIPDAHNEFLDNFEKRISRLENLFAPKSRKTESYEQLSHLEILADGIKRSLINSIPPTDEICSFNFTLGRCSPLCHCGFQYKFGDYTPSRSCRLLHQENILNCTISAEDNDPWVSRLGRALSRRAHMLLEILRKYSPPTNPECRFDFKTFDCTPYQDCFFDFQLGDFSLDRACRLIL